jgi:hypothetical protein
MVARELSLEKILEILRQQLPMLTERYSVERLEIFPSRRATATWISWSRSKKCPAC